MAKKQKSNIIQLFPIIGTVLGIIAVVMIFLPAISIKDTEVTYTGLQTAFGYTQEGLFGDRIIFKFSLILFVGFIIAIGAVAFAVFHLLTPKNKSFLLFAVVCFVLSALCYFFQIELLSVGDGFLSELVGSYLNPDLAKETMQLGVGAVVGGIASVLSAIACALPIFIKK